MAPVAVRSISHVRPEDRRFPIPERANWWIQDPSVSLGSGDIPVVRHTFAEPSEPPWHWGERIFIVNRLMAEPGIELMETIRSNVVGLHETTGDLFFSLGTSFNEDWSEITPFFRSTSKPSRPLVTSVEVEENPIVLVIAPIRNRYPAKVVARRNAVFKTGSSTNMDHSQ